LPNVETVQSLISKMYNNMTNAINGNEIIVDGHHVGTYVDEIEGNSSSKEFYNAVDGGCIAMVQFQKCLLCNNIEVFSQLTLDIICALEMNKRKKGSKNLEQRQNLCNNH
jgi:hypothetical protein